MKFKDVLDKTGTPLYGDLTGQVYDGNIHIANMGVTSLEGCPKYIVGSFNCSDNELTTLEYAPTGVTGYFNIVNNNLKSFKHAPTSVKGAFWADKNDIKSENIMDEIIKNGIEASRYMIDDKVFNWNSVLSDEIKEFKKMGTSVKSKGFRTLLGLNK